MKLFQAVKTCGEIASLGIPEKYFADDYVDIPEDKAVQTLALAAKFVVDELFVEYGEIVRQTVKVLNNRIELPQNCRVHSLTEKNGNNLRFSYVEGGLYTENHEEVVVVYTLPPDDFGWKDELPLPNNGTSERALVYGMMSEYFVLSGDTEQAASWRVKFEDCIEQTAVRKLCGGRMPAGRWLR